MGYMLVKVRVIFGRVLTKGSYKDIRIDLSMSVSDMQYSPIEQGKKGARTCFERDIF
jgi:hypothetical protein